MSIEFMEDMTSLLMSIFLAGLVVLNVVIMVIAFNLDSAVFSVNGEVVGISRVGGIITILLIAVPWSFGMFKLFANLTALMRL